jgi:hypothetical protein
MTRKLEINNANGVHLSVTLEPAILQWENACVLHTLSLYISAIILGRVAQSGMAAFSVGPAHVYKWQLEIIPLSCAINVVLLRATVYVSAL